MGSSEIDIILDKWNRNADFLIEILQDVQDACRHLPRETMGYIADELRVPLAQVHHLATFYKAFSLDKKGEYELQVCMGTACHVKGARRVLDALSRELEVEPGKTTADGKFTLEAVRCVGCCGLAPVLVVGDEIQSGVAPHRALKLVERYRKESANGTD